MEAEGVLRAAADARERALGPENADTLYNLGILLQQAQRLDEAIACYDKALKLNPSLKEASEGLKRVS